jgi:hypothetical protein
MQNPQVAPILQRPIRRWKSHKIVEAEKITGIEPQIVHNQHPLILGDGLDAPRFVVNDEFRDKHDPKVGDYLVKYSDGYVSVSPAKAFEEGYHLFDEASDPQSGLTFGLALEALKLGKRVARSGWNGKGMWLSMSCKDSRSVAAENFWSPHNAQFARDSGGTATVLPSITMKTATNEIQMGWLASQTDMLSEDWTILD